MSEFKTSYSYDIEVPAVAKNKIGWILIYTLPIRTMPVKGHKVYFAGKYGDHCRLSVKEVEHFITSSSEEFSGTIDASHLDQTQSKVLQNILKEMGVKAHSRK